MKTNGKTIFTAVALVCGLCFSSCVDETIDLDNVSLDMYLDGDYSFPLLHADSVTMRDLLNAYGNIETDEVSMDSANSGGALLLAIYYHNRFSYNLKSAEEINGSFEDLETSIYNVNLEVTPNNEDEYGGARLNLDSISGVDGIKPGETKGPGNQYYIHKVEFKNTDINIVRVGGATGLNIESIKIGDPGQSFYPVPVDDDTIRVKGVDLTVLHDDTITVKYTNSTTGTQKIKIQFKPQDWTVYGWFDLAFDSLKSESFSADIKRYIGNSRLKFKDPRFDFDVYNTNLGVPLVVNLNKIESNLGTVQLNSTADVPGFDFHINYPEVFTWDSLTETAVTPISVDRTQDGRYGFNLADFEKLFGITEDSIKLLEFSSDIAIFTDQSKYNTAAAAGFDPEVEPLQFVSSKAEFDVVAKAVLPFWMEKGYLEYNRTMPIDLSFSNDTLATGGRLHIADSTTIYLVINWTNALPMSIWADFELLDKNGNPVLVDGKPWVETITMNRGEVNADGFVTAPTKSTTEIWLSKEAYDIRKNVAKVRVSYSSEDDGNGSGTPQEIKVRLDDYFTVQAGIEIKGRVDRTEKETDD